MFLLYHPLMQHACNAASYLTWQNALGSFAREKEGQVLLCPVSHGVTTDSTICHRIFSGNCVLLKDIPPSNTV